jgi:mono/diheme cytochrome c family protein
MVAEGDSLFNSGRCAKCHGRGGTGGDDGAALTTGRWQLITGAYPDLVVVITNGVPGGVAPGMPPRGGTAFTDEQLRAVAAYVWTLTHH